MTLGKARTGPGARTKADCARMNSSSPWRRHHAVTTVRPRAGFVTRVASLSDLVAKHCPLGVQKRCTKCAELWPADGEFFYRSSRGGLQPCCRACTDEAKRARNVRKAVANG